VARKRNPTGIYLGRCFLIRCVFHAAAVRSCRGCRNRFAGHHCVEAVRPCPRCQRRRHVKDHRCRRLDTVFGRLVVDAARFDGCRHCGERRITSPVSELVPERVSPELRHLQAKPAAQLPCRQARGTPRRAVAGNRRSESCHNTRPNARRRQTRRWGFSHIPAKRFNPGSRRQSSLGSDPVGAQITWPRLSSLSRITSGSNWRHLNSPEIDGTRNIRAS
jgi:hypothetical protein